MAKDYDKAERYARDTERLTLEVLKTRTMASDSNLAIALGAALEVQAKLLAETGQRASAVAYLRTQIATIATRPSTCGSPRT